MLGDSNLKKIKTVIKAVFISNSLKLLPIEILFLSQGLEPLLFLSYTEGVCCIFLMSFWWRDLYQATSYSVGNYKSGLSSLMCMILKKLYHE